MLKDKNDKVGTGSGNADRAGATGRFEPRRPDKQRYLDAVRHIRQDELCFFEFEMDFIPVKDILGHDIDPVPSFLLPIKDYVELIEKTGMDMAYVQLPWKLGRNKYVDEKGRTLYTEGTISEFGDLKKIRYPSMDGIKKRIEEVLEGIKDTKAGVIYGLELNSILVYKAMRYEDYYTFMVENPEFIKEFQKRLEEYALKQAETVFEYPVDAIRLDSNLCMNSGPIVSRAFMEEFEFPCIRKFIDLIHKNGRIVEMHTDGYFESLIPDFIAMGVDVLNPIDSCAGIQDIYKIKQQCKDRIALHGNIDVGGVLAFGSAEEVKKDTIEHIEKLGASGGYIVGSSHDIHENIPAANFLAMAEAAHNTKNKILK